MKNRSITSVGAELVRKLRMFSSSRTRRPKCDQPILEMSYRQRQQMPEQPCPELDIDPIGGVGKR